MDFLRISKGVGVDLISQLTWQTEEMAWSGLRFLDALVKTSWDDPIPFACTGMGFGRCILGFERHAG